MLSLNVFNQAIVPACRCSSIASKSLNFNYRNLSSEKAQTSSMKALEENFKPIYRFPKIKIAAAVNKLKNYQAIITTLGVPITYFACPEVIVEFGYTGGSLMIALCIASFITKGSIGAVYVDKKNSDRVRIAYIDFWGSRKDIELNVEDIQPIYETKNSFSPFTKVTFNNNHKSLIFISTAADVLDPCEFSRIFGE